MTRDQIVFEIQKCLHRNQAFNVALGNCEPFSFKEGAVLAVCQGTWAALAHWKAQLAAYDVGC